jgi:hypothetical protein
MKSQLVPAKNPPKNIQKSAKNKVNLSQLESRD